MASPIPMYSPSKINLYRSCPERYFHKYVERRRVDEPFSRPLSIGGALHQVLADCMTEYRDQRSFPINLRERVEAALPACSYSGDVAPFWETDVAEVVNWVHWALSQFTEPFDVIGVEEMLFLRPGKASFTLCAKVDLVVRRPDGSIEHIDFKTGRAHRDHVQEIVSRVVVRGKYGNDQPVRTTSMFVREQATVSEVLDREACRELWQEIVQSIRNMEGGESWDPSPSALCSYCPYFGNGCSVLERDGDDWLDVA